jgi:hypothetical protein
MQEATMAKGAQSSITVWPQQPPCAVYCVQHYNYREAEERVQCHAWWREGTDAFKQQLGSQPQVTAASLLCCSTGEMELHNGIFACSWMKKHVPSDLAKMVHWWYCLQAIFAHQLVHDEMFRKKKCMRGVARSRVVEPWCRKGCIWSLLRCRYVRMVASGVPKHF